MSGLETATAIVAVFMIAEGAALLFVREESWRNLCAYLSRMTAGQVHTAGITMLVCGAVLLAAALL